MCNPEIKINTLLLKHSKFSCHPAVKHLYIHSKNINLQYDLPDSLVEEMQRLQPLHTVKISENEYEFFAGWLLLPLCRKIDLEKVTVVVHAGLSEDKLIELSIIYLLSLHLNSVHRSSNLIQFQTLLEKIAPELRKKILGDYYSCSSQVCVTNLSNETRSAIQNQMSNLVKNKSSKGKKSILERFK